MEHDKKFVIVGNKNAVTYSEIFPLIQHDRMWIGYTPMGKETVFGVPPEVGKELLASKRDRSYTVVDGTVMARAQSCWFTNLDVSKRHEDLILYKSYDPSYYPRYDHYDAIDVGQTKEIPMDFDGVMGVPITFLDKHNPDQFEILSCNDIRKSDAVPFKQHGLIKDKDSAIDGKPTYVRIPIRNKQPA